MRLTFFPLRCCPSARRAAGAVAVVAFCGCSHTSPPSPPSPPSPTSPPTPSAYSEEIVRPPATWDRADGARLLDFDPAAFVAECRALLIEINVSPIEPENRLLWRDCLAPEIEKYPADVLNWSPFAVYPCRVLEVFGTRIGGTYFSGGVLVAHSNLQLDHAPRWVARALHHEVATLLLMGHWSKFRGQEWLELNPEGFAYREDAFAAIRERAFTGKLANDLLLSDGFVTDYAQVSLFDDFSEVSSHLFVGDAEFWQAVGEHEALAKKVRLTLDFFESIHPGLSEAYFRSLAVAPPPKER